MFYSYNDEHFVEDYEQEKQLNLSLARTALETKDLQVLFDLATCECELLIYDGPEIASIALEIAKTLQHVPEYILGALSAATNTAMFSESEPQQKEAENLLSDLLKYKVKPKDKYSFISTIIDVMYMFDNLSKTPKEKTSSLFKMLATEFCTCLTCKESWPNKKEYIQYAKALIAEHPDLAPTQDKNPARPKSHALKICGAKPQKV